MQLIVHQKLEISASFICVCPFSCLSWQSKLVASFLVLSDMDVNRNICLMWATGDSPKTILSNREMFRQYCILQQLCSPLPVLHLNLSKQKAEPCLFGLLCLLSLSFKSLWQENLQEFWVNLKAKIPHSFGHSLQNLVSDPLLLLLSITLSQTMQHDDPYFSCPQLQGHLQMRTLVVFSSLYNQT